MGKFVEEKQVVETYIKNYIETTSDFSRFIEGSPNFVTFYSKDIQASTEDMTLGGVLETIGSESPIKYNKVENFPIYNMEEINPELSLDDETGLDTRVESTAIILPNTLKPLPNDYFVVDYLNKRYLFRISNVETNNINNRVFYRISYFLTSDNIDILEERQVTEKYKVVYENLGKEAKSVIKESDFLLLEKLDDNYIKLWEFYERFYYNENFNTFLYIDRLYDNMLMKFIGENNLFIKTRTFLKNIKVEQMLKETDSEYLNYQGSIFYALENHDKDYLMTFYYDSIAIKERSSVFNLYKNMYEVNRIRYVEKTEFNDPVELLDKDFVDNICNNTLFEGKINSDYKLMNFIIQYLNNSLNKEDFTKHIDREVFRQSLSNYIVIPCILFIIKKIKEDILNKKL